MKINPYGWRTVVLRPRGLHCDTPNCGWRDESAVWNDTVNIDRLCPNCGSNVYTRQDYLALKRAMRLALSINMVLLPLWPLRLIHNLACWFCGADSWGRMLGKMNGTGTIKFGPVEPLGKDSDTCKKCK